MQKSCERKKCSNIYVLTNYLLHTVMYVARTCKLRIESFLELSRIPGFSDGFDVS